MRYFRPPYVGAKGWVGVVLDEKPGWAEVTRLLRDAYVFVASRKLAELEAMPAVRSRPQR